MGFGGLTSGERKRLQQGILTPKQATLISARAEAKSGGGGFWSSTWGQVIRGVGIAALNFVPVVGTVASAGTAAYDRQRFSALAKNANERYSAELTASREQAKTAIPPFFEVGPYPWSPEYGRIGVPGYTGGVINVGGSSEQAPSSEGDFTALVQSVQPWQWLVVGVLSLVFLFALLRKRR